MDNSTPPPPQQQPELEPEQKKLKMSSTTTTSDDDETTTTTNPQPTDRKPRYKRRKIAIFLAYCGVGYQGMQKNPGAKTIEGELEEALYHAGGVPDHDRGKPQRFDWARSARTDKGVSAVGQVVSGRFYIDPPGFVDRLNSILPNQIRIFGFKRVTNSFSAKKFCDRRRYIYLMPVFALDSTAHRDRESVLASLGSENELVKCLECSERGRSRHKTVSELQAEEDAREIKNANNGGASFCYGEKEKARFNGILNRYVGTHNFHNFTTRIKAEDPSAIRYIISFNADNVVTVDGMDFVKCEVVGQSFMLHQIRKLVGLAVAIMRGCAPPDLIDVALKKDVNINVPTAPEVGLYLEECLFTSYNQKWRDTHEEITMEPYADQAEDFKMKQVYSHIASMEQKEGTVAIWLHSLNYRNYADFCYLEGSTAGNNGQNAPRDDLNCGASSNGETALLNNIKSGADTNGENALLHSINTGAGSNGENALHDSLNNGASTDGENASLDNMNNAAGAIGGTAPLDDINTGAGTNGEPVQVNSMEVEVETTQFAWPILGDHEVHQLTRSRRILSSIVHFRKYHNPVGYHIIVICTGSLPWKRDEMPEAFPYCWYDHVLCDHDCGGRRKDITRVHM